MGPFSRVLELLIFKIFWLLRLNRDTKLSLNPQRGPFNVKMLPPPLRSNVLHFSTKIKSVIIENDKLLKEKFFIKSKK